VREVQLEPGKLYEVGGKLMVVCAACGKLVRADKPLVGSWHLCLTEEERRKRDWKP
jgi:hypothetical protein